MVARSVIGMAGEYFFIAVRRAVHGVLRATIPEIVEQGPMIFSLGVAWFVGWGMAIASQPAVSSRPGFWSSWSVIFLIVTLVGILLWCVRAVRAKLPHEVTLRDGTVVRASGRLQITESSASGGSTAGTTEQTPVQLKGAGSSASGGGGTLSLTSVEQVPPTDQDGGRET
jgi:hypothetical protein